MTPGVEAADRRTQPGTSGNVTVSVHDDTPLEAHAIDEGLGEANAQSAPLDRVVPLSCFARTDAGSLAGGAVGRTWGACCELQQLWVDPAHRRRRIATQLVRAFEGRAAARGCTTFYLETFSFQAPQLYKSLGYRVQLELRGFPDGIAKYVMVRHAASANRPDPTPGG
jgi:ribosomal protein S18 acetylase RimI-like enzyme